jgi:opacity protein-like surface antigen
MKKIILTSVILVITLSMNAQNFGVRAGADFATAKADFDGIKLSENETGFYIGAFTKIEVSEAFKIRPEVNYIYIKDLNQIQVPVLAEIGVSDKFNLLAGPSFAFLLDTEEGAKSFNFGLDFGLSYDISKQFLIEARYNLGLSNLVDDNEFNATLRLHGLFVGIGYMF